MSGTRSAIGSNQVCITVSGLKRTQADPHTLTLMPLPYRCCPNYAVSFPRRTQHEVPAQTELALPTLIFDLSEGSSLLTALSIASLASASPDFPSDLWLSFPGFSSFSCPLAWSLQAFRPQSFLFLSVRLTDCHCSNAALTVPGSSPPITGFQLSTGHSMWCPTAP